MLAREAASFWRENVVAVVVVAVIAVVVVAETSYQMLEVLAFAIGRGLNLLQ